MNVAGDQNILAESNWIQVNSRVSLAELDAFLLQRGKFIPYFSFPADNRTVEQFILEGSPGLYGRKFGPIWSGVKELVPSSFSESAYKELVLFLRRFQREILASAPQAVALPTLPLWQLQGHMKSDLRKVFWGSRGRLGNFEMITLTTWPRPAVQVFILGRFYSLGRFALAHPYLLKSRLDFYGFYQVGSVVELVAGYFGDLEQEARLLGRLQSVRAIVEEFGGEVYNLQLSQIPARFFPGLKRGNIEVGVLPERLPAVLIELERSLGSRGIFYTVAGNADQGYLSVRSPSEVAREVAEVVLSYNGLISQVDLLPALPRNIFRQFEEIFNS